MSPSIDLLWFSFSKKGKKGRRVSLSAPPFSSRLSLLPSISSPNLPLSTTLRVRLCAPPDTIAIASLFPIQERGKTMYLLPTSKDSGKEISRQQSWISILLTLSSFAPRLASFLASLLPFSRVPSFQFPLLFPFVPCIRSISHPPLFPFHPFLRSPNFLYPTLHLLLPFQLPLLSLSILFFFFVAFLEFLILYASPFTSVPIATALSPPLSSTLFFFAAFAKFLILYTSPLLSIPITSAFSPSFFFLPSIRWISRSLHFTFHPRRFLFFVASVQFLPYTSHFSLLSQLPLLSLPSTFFFFQIFHHPILFPLILSSFFAFFLFSFVLLTTALCPSRRLFSSFAESPALRGNHLFFFLALILAFNPSPDLSASFTAYAADPSTRYDRVRERTGQIWISVCYPFPLPASLDKKMSRSRRERSRTKSSGFDTPIPRFEKAFDRWKMNDPQEERSRASNNPYMGRETRFKTVINPC